MPRTTIPGMFVAAIAAVQPAIADDSGTLTIRADGFTHQRGRAVAKLFVPGDNARGTGRWQQIAHITPSGLAVFAFPGLVDGRYAVVVFHDENSNGIIDHGVIGPSEPLGFSGEFRLLLFSGLPTFDKLQFEFKGPNQTIELQVR